ncbi:hypothetical protein [Paenibacillus lemnae]|uniref:Uncharacterized protein n=1 Tax=Paenibacillus lemnae TaxID=1330551 RepID=A0A848M9W1_PAELE|nr:hypothetical protein [Paenibacillus lemnae]NMO97465.1 hypothetical protein [Paenibacillus lemnae]
MLQDIKVIGATLMKAGNIELYKQLLDYQADAQKLIDENMKLKEENRVLKEKLMIQSELEFRNNQYFRIKDGIKLGPYCTRCWDAESKLINLHQSNDGYSDCPSCKVSVVNNQAPYNQSYDDSFGW